MNFSARVDSRAVEEALKQLSGRDVQAAINRSLNRAATTLRKEASQEVRKTYALKARDLGERVLRVEKSNTSKLAAEVHITGANIPLGQFGNPAETRKGVRVTVKRGAGRVLYPRSFKAQIRGGKTQVYWRAKSGSGGNLVPRGPLRILLGPSVAQVVSAPAFVAKLLRSASDRIATTLRQEIAFRLNRKSTPNRFTRGR